MYTNSFLIRIIACKGVSPLTPKTVLRTVVNREPMKSKENRSIPISFRLTASEFELYTDVLARTKLTKTDFFRGVFLEKKYTFHVHEKRPVEYDRLLFLFNKTSNNMNQIAHKLNGAYRRGIVSEKVYVEYLNNLISIERLLDGYINKC